MKERLNHIYEILLRTYPDAHCTLDIITPEYFLISNILSPQCTDRVANAVSHRLHDKYSNISELANASISDISNIIRPCGLHNNKSKNIKNSAIKLTKEYKAKLPKNFSELIKFPGIGRKTALVIMHEIFRINEGIVIDTHNIRVSKRIGISNSSKPDVVEKELKMYLRQNRWRMWSHLMVRHGRELCLARNPKCNNCPIRESCEYGINLNK